jgi:hypothetical protein
MMNIQISRNPCIKESLGAAHVRGASISTTFLVCPDYVQCLTCSYWKSVCCHITEPCGNRPLQTRREESWSPMYPTEKSTDGTATDLNSFCRKQGQGIPKGDKRFVGSTWVITIRVVSAGRRIPWMTLWLLSQKLKFLFHPSSSKPYNTDLSLFISFFLTQRRPGFDPRASHVGFVVDKVALGQVSSE